MGDGAGLGENVSGAPASSRTLLDSDAAGSTAIRGGSLRVAGYLAGAALSAVSAAAMFRALGVDGAGMYVTALAIVTLACSLTDAGLATVGVRELASHAGNRQERFMRSLLGVRLALGAAGVVLAIAFAGIAGYESVMVAAVGVAGLAALLQVSQQTLTVPLMAELRFPPVVIIDLVRQAVSTLLMIAAALAGAGLLVFVGVSIPALLVALIATVPLVAGMAPVVPAIEVGEWKQLLRETLPFALATAVAAVYFRSAVIIVSLIATEYQTGLFGASFRVVEVLIIVPQLAVGAAFPIFARAATSDRERLEYGVGRTLDVSAVTGVGLALFLVVGAPTVISVIAGSSFAGSEPVLRIQGLALAAAFVGAPLAYALLSLHRHRAVLVASVVGLVANLTLVTSLTFLSGIRGAAIATFIAELAMTVGFAVGVYRSGLRPDHRAGQLPRVLIAGLFALSPLLIPGLPNLAAVALSVVLYGALILLFKALPGEVLVEARRLLRQPRT